MSQCVSTALWDPPVLEGCSSLLQGTHPQLNRICLCASGLASLAPVFSFIMSFFDSRISLQGSSEVVRGFSESLQCSKVILDAPGLAFKPLGELSRSKMSFHSSMVDLQGSYKSIYCSRVTLHCSSISLQRSGWATIAPWWSHMDMEWGQHDFGSIMFHFWIPSYTVQ